MVFNRDILLKNYKNSDSIYMIKYQEKIGPIPDSITECNWYKSYVSKFNVENIQYNVPEELKNDFDWKLLLQLAAASNSCNIALEDEPDGIELLITVKSGDQTLTKKVSELWSFQVMRLYEIYLNELFSMEVLKLENEQEKSAINTLREGRILEFNNSISELNKIYKLKNLKSLFDDFDKGRI